MRNPDPTIERLLAGLRDAEPPPGMHHRILDGMVARRATTYRPRRLLHLAAAMSLACALAITLWVTHHRHTPTTLRSDTTHVDSPRTKLPKTVASITSREPRRRPTSRALPRATQTLGFPAPPLPLTAQEKMLLRLAHRNDPQDLNLLNPDAQSQQSAKATQQFQQFFEMNPNEMRSESE